MTDAPRLRLPKWAPLAAGLAVALLFAGAGGYLLGRNHALSVSQVESGGRVLYWYDPMRPEVHFDRPGKSPFMDMDLAPRYADEIQDGGVRIDPGVAQNLGVRTAVVERRDLARSVLAPGVIAFSERSLAVVQARGGSFVERSYGRAIGDVVRAGTPIVDIRVPEWTAAQAEYLALRGGDGALAQAARSRLAMLGMPEALIARVERDGAPRPIFTVSAPVSGAITALDMRQGMTVTPGAPIATINGLSPIWLVVSLPQADAALARPGTRVTATLPAYPGESFSGRVEAVLPAANPATRTVEVRIALANPQLRLRPGMTAEVRLDQGADTDLVVPAEAVIRTGERSVVIVALNSGRYATAEVSVGRQQGDFTEIRSGLSEGQRVVASGQFLIDSEANLSGALARLNASRPAQQPAVADATHEAIGRITAINGPELMIAHAPIASLNWPAMTMQFRLARADLAHGLAVGDSVAFSFHEADGAYVIDGIRETEPRR